MSVLIQGQNTAAIFTIHIYIAMLTSRIAFFASNKGISSPGISVANAIFLCTALGGDHIKDPSPVRVDRAYTKCVNIASRNYGKIWRT